MLLLVIMTDMKRKSRPRKRDTMPLGHLARRGRPCGVASTSFCGYTAVQRLQDATKRSLWMLMPCSACVTTYYLNMLLDSWPRVDIEAQHCWDGIWLQVWPYPAAFETQGGEMYYIESQIPYALFVSSCRSSRPLWRTETEDIGPTLASHLHRTHNLE